MYSVIILTTDDQEHTFSNLEGPKARARESALSRFRQQHPDAAIADTLICPMAELYDAHTCRDPGGRGCCEYCGGVIPGSWLDRELNGGD